MIKLDVPTIVAVCLSMTAAQAVTPAGTEAQEADVRAAVTETLEAWTEGDFESFTGHYHDQVRGFFLDGGALTLGFDVAALQMAYDAGLRADMELRDLDVSVFGETAVSVGYLDGSITLPGGEATIAGTWRYSETRVPVGGRWKVVQYHFSQLTGGR